MEDKFESRLKKVRILMAAFSLSVITFVCRENGIKGLIGNLPNDEYKNIYKENHLNLKNKERQKIKSELEEELAEVICLSEIEEDELENYFLLNAILENPSLKEEEKRYLYHLIDMIIENPYLNKEHSYESLCNLKYVYKADNIVDEGKSAGYAPLNDIIELYDFDVKETAICHENIHALYDHEHLVRKLPHFFEEGMTEILNREYLGNDPFSVCSAELNGREFVYLPEITATKYLCELVGADKVLEAYTKEDMSIIYNSLLKIRGNKIGAIEFIWDLNYITKKIKISEKLDFEEDKKAFVKMQEYQQKLLEKDSSFKTDASDYYISMLKSFYENSSYSERVMDFIEKNGIFERAYFSQKLKEESKDSIVCYSERLTYYNGRLYENIIYRESVKEYKKLK